MASDSRHIKSTAGVRGLRPSKGWPTWTLLDGEELNQQYPFTFQLPPASARYYAPVGTIVKLFFEATDKGMAEFNLVRDWVRVSSRETVAGRFVFHGRVTCQPLFGWMPRLADDIIFGPEHIIQIEERSTQEGERIE